MLVHIYIHIPLIAFHHTGYTSINQLQITKSLTLTLTLTLSPSLTFTHTPALTTANRSVFIRTQ
jgi:hypothetical protein